MMLSIDQKSCIPKYPHCDIPMDRQPDGLLKSQIVRDADNSTREIYTCFKCDYGYAMNSSNDYRCEECSTFIDECVECYNGTNCIKCEDGYYPSPNGDVCLEDIDNCLVDPIHYVPLDNNTWACPSYCSSLD